VVASFTRDGSGAVSIGTIDINTEALKLYDANDQSGIIDKERTVGGTTAAIGEIDISALSDSVDDIEIMDNYIKIADAALNDIISAGSALGASKQRIDLQSSFVTNLSDAITKGVGALVDADMNVESTRLQALQVQQQLGVQALSIANQNTQMILRLFN
jgi:flagellin